MDQWVLYGRTTSELSKAIEKLKVCFGSQDSCSIDQVPDAHLWQELGLISVKGDCVKPGPKVACLSSVVDSRVGEVLNDAVSAYSAYLSDHALPQLRVIVDSWPEGQRFTWKRLEHITLMGMLMDLVVRLCALQNGLIQSQPEDFWVWRLPAFEKRRFEFGVRLLPSDRCSGVAQLWYEGSDAPPIALNSTELNLLDDIVTGHSPNCAPESLIRLRFWGLVQSSNGFQLDVPVILCRRGDGLWDCLEQIASNIAVDIYSDLLDEIQIGDPNRLASVRQALTRLLMTRTASDLIDSGAVSAPSNSRQHSLWIWREMPDFKPITNPGQCRSKLCKE